VRDSSVAASAVIAAITAMVMCRAHIESNARPPFSEVGDDPTILLRRQAQGAIPHECAEQDERADEEAHDTPNP